MSPRPRRSFQLRQQVGLAFPGAGADFPRTLLSQRRDPAPGAWSGAAWPRAPRGPGPWPASRFLQRLAKQGRPGAVTALDIHTWVLLPLHLAVTSRKPPLSQESCRGSRESPPVRGLRAGAHHGLGLAARTPGHGRSLALLPALSGVSGGRGRARRAGAGSRRRRERSRAWRPWAKPGAPRRPAG